MTNKVDSIRLFLSTCSGEDSYIISKCSKPIQISFALIGFFVLTIFFGCFISALFFSYSVFDEAKWISIPLGIFWGAIITNIYLLLLFTITPKLLPVAIKKKQPEKNTISYFITSSMLFRLGLMLLLAIIIAQPLNVEFVGKTVSGAKNLASKAVDFANPMTYIKKYMPKIMDSKGFKKAVGSLPKIGKIASAAMIAYDLMSHGADAAAAAKAGASPKDIGKQVVMALGDLGGSVIGGVLGSLIPIPGVGTMVGSFLGGLGGSALAGLIADNTDVSGIGNWMINSFGNPKNAGKAEDFILQDGKMTKFRKDDVIIGGTNLGGNSSTNAKTIQLLERLVAAVERGGTVHIDGQKVGKALVLGSYKSQ